MLVHCLQYASLAATFVDIALAAKASKIVPQGLQSAFADSDVDIQVSYTNDAVDGFIDGTKFSKDAVADEPTFALGDSSAISTSTRFTVLMIDVTEDNNQILHYARPNFQHTDIVEIGNASDAIQAYKAPGSLKETGDGRKYAFLLYRNPQDAELSDLTLPAQGKAFDAAQFQSDNGFKDPEAGIGMVVDLGGQLSTGNDGSTSTTAAGGASSVSSKAAASSAAASSTAAPEASTTDAGSGSTTVQSEAPASTTDVVASVTSTTAVAESSTGIVAASSVIQGNSTASSTFAQSSLVPTSSSTSSGTPAQQTDSAASVTLFGASTCVLTVFLSAFAALLA